MTTASPSGISARQLRCIRDDRVLFESLDLQAAPGEILLIEGANGSGKTSLLRILAGLSLPDAGEVYWQGSAIMNSQLEYAENMAFLGHQTGIKEDLTPQENLAFLLGLHGTSLDTSSHRAKSEALLGTLGLYGFEDVLCRNLSAGQKRRVALARLLASGKQLWILDEPFTAIDKTGVAFVEQSLCDHVQGGGIVLLTTHHDIDLPHCEPTRIRLS